MYIHSMLSPMSHLTDVQNNISKSMAIDPVLLHASAHCLCATLPQTDTGADAVDD